LFPLARGQQTQRDREGEGEGEGGSFICDQKMQVCARDGEIAPVFFMIAPVCDIVFLSALSSCAFGLDSKPPPFGRLADCKESQTDCSSPAPPLPSSTPPSRPFCLLSLLLILLLLLLLRGFLCCFLCVCQQLFDLPTNAGGRITRRGRRRRKRRK